MTFGDISFVAPLITATKSAVTAPLTTCAAPCSLCAILPAASRQNYEPSSHAFLHSHPPPVKKHNSSCGCLHCKPLRPTHQTGSNSFTVSNISLTRLTAISRSALPSSKEAENTCLLISNTCSKL